MADVDAEFKMAEPEQSHCEEKETSRNPEVRRVVAVMSGKGGVGKSSITALLATGLARSGWTVGILDADITGPSIPKMFGLKPGSAVPTGEGEIQPAVTGLGIKVMSLNLLLPREDDAVIWRGPMLAGAVKQFWSEVTWGKLDYLLLDLPPGTGDVPLTVMQSLPLAGVVIVTSPQDLAAMIVRKAIRMTAELEVPVLGLVENMSYAICPHCGEELQLFGPSHAAEMAEAAGLPLLVKLPLDPRLAGLCDAGRVEEYEEDRLHQLAAAVVDRLASQEAGRR